MITSWETGAATWHFNGGAVGAIAVEQYASEGSKSIKLAYNDNWGHFQYNFPASLDLSNFTKLQLHVVNSGTPLTIKVSIPTGSNWVWHVSPGQSVPYGSKLLEFDLQANNWTLDNGTGSISNLDQVQGLVIIVEEAQFPNAIYIDNLRKIGPLDGLTPIPSQEGELVESWEGGLGSWPYTNGGATTVEHGQDYSSDGNHSIKLSFNGSWSHFQYNFPQIVNLAEWGDLQLHLVNTGEQMNVKIVLSTGDGWAWNTSPLQPLPHGAHLLAFDLAAHNWEKDGVLGALTTPDQVKAIVIIVEGDNYPGSIYVDNLRRINNQNSSGTVLYHESFESGTSHWAFDATGSDANGIAQVTDNVTDGTYAAKLLCNAPGWWSYWYNQLPQPIDLSGANTVTLDATAVNAANIKLIIVTNGWEWHETTPQEVTGGTLAYDLTGIDQVKRQNVLTLGLGIDAHGQPCNLYVDNIRILAAETQGSSAQDDSHAVDSKIYLPIVSQ